MTGTLLKTLVALAGLACQCHGDQGRKLSSAQPFGVWSGGNAGFRQTGGALGNQQAIYQTSGNTVTNSNDRGAQSYGTTASHGIATSSGGGSVVGGQDVVGVNSNLSQVNQQGYLVQTGQAGANAQQDTQAQSLYGPAITNTYQQTGSQSEANLQASQAYTSGTAEANFGIARITGTVNGGSYLTAPGSAASSAFNSGGTSNAEGYWAQAGKVEHGSSQVTDQYSTSNQQTQSTAAALGGSVYTQGANGLNSGFQGPGGRSSDSSLSQQQNGFGYGSNTQTNTNSIGFTSSNPHSSLSEGAIQQTTSSDFGGAAASTDQYLTAQLGSGVSGTVGTSGDAQAVGDYAHANTQSQGSTFTTNLGNDLHYTSVSSTGQSQSDSHSFQQPHRKLREDGAGIVKIQIKEGNVLPPLDP